MLHILAGLALFLFLLAGLARALLSPVTEIAYENRPAKRFPAFSVSAFLRGEYQDAAEAAVADQLPGASYLKKLYNIFDAGLALPAVRTLAADGGYVGFRDICFFGDMLTVRPLPLASREAALLESARIINAWASESPDVPFYVYYIETDRDLDLETGEKPGLYACLAGALTIPADHVGRLRIDSYDDYRRFFLRTDHHWGAAGAWEGYREICALLGTEPLPLLGRFTRPACYRGTRAAGVEGAAAEDFSVNLYDAPGLRFSVSGEAVPGYGAQERFVAGEPGTVSYGSIFGGDCGELLIDTGREGENLLILGDSYDNAIVIPLAAGYASTWCVDLRAYAAQTGHGFVMADFLREKEIDRVLLVAGIDYFGATLAQGGW